MVAAAGLLAGCAPPDGPPPAPPTGGNQVTLTAAQRARLQVQTVAAGPFRRTIEATATVGFDNNRATTVLAPVSGPVARLLVPLGAAVKAGDPLATLASADFAAAITGYRKAVATALNVRRNADRAQQLFAHGAIAQRDLEQAQTDALSAEADREAALEQLHSLGVDDQTIQDTGENRPIPHLTGIIRSPIAGTLVEKLISPGTLLQAGTTPCFTVADLSQVWVMANVFETDIEAIQLGDAAEIETSVGAQALPGTVDNIAAILDPNTRAIGVRIVAANPQGVLRKQMYVRVRIHSRREYRGSLIPVSAMLRDDENLPFVYVALADNRFARRRVTVGYRVADRYEVTAGLSPGEAIVVEGGLFVQFLQAQ